MCSLMLAARGQKIECKIDRRNAGLQGHGAHHYGSDTQKTGQKVASYAFDILVAGRAPHWASCMQNLHAGLDVADKTTVICIVDDEAQLIFEAVAETTPAAIAAALKPYRRKLKSIGQETGTKSAWLHKELARAKFPIHSLDARHAHAALQARLNKTDANDALGIATLMARGIYTSAHVRSDEAIRIRMVLALREALLHKAGDLRHSMRMIGKQLGAEAPMSARHRKSAENESESALRSAVNAARRVSDAAMLEVANLNTVLDDLVDGSPLCRRLMTIPGVGAITALTFVAAVDDPHRFKSSRDVGPYFGLTPRTFQSGTVTRSGGISHRGDKATRKALYIAARVLLTNSHSTCSLRRWGLKIASAKGRRLAYIAVARKLAVLMHPSGSLERSLIRAAERVQYGENLTIPNDGLHI